MLKLPQALPRKLPDRSRSPRLLRALPVLPTRWFRRAEFVFLPQAEAGARCKVRQCVRCRPGTTKFAGFVPGGFGFQTAQGRDQPVQFAVVDGSAGAQD
ncbi:MAG: hypothetical protein DLM68_16875 [Hyphomicrobiales bacterium]|nr:MAG: hypothetical protein DLM68_16875 [Hyphomicrobiales bacterium]